jgi:hypothetical protein
MKIPDKMPENFCIAPFQSIRQNAYGRNSPCAFGAGEWHHGELTPAERWDSKELNSLRQQFINNEKPEECHRCWAEEDASKRSLRQRQPEYFPNDYEEFIKSGKWVNGPKTAVFKTSNVCNLACRSCGGWDTNFYAPEGKYYQKKYETTILFKGENVNHNRFIPILAPKHTDFMSYIPIMDNIEKIDFYGGEPLLNTSQLELLQYLVDKGLSKNITLYYSTNCTNKPTKRLVKLWSQFKRLELALSVDGIDEQFEYLRWPGKWSEALENVNTFVALKGQFDCDVHTMSSYTVGALNVWYVDDMIKWHKEVVGDYYINMIETPDYMAIHILPDDVKAAIRAHVKDPEVLGYLDIKPHNPLLFKQFIIWMKRQDEYRKQNFADVFPEYYAIIKPYWDSITDLSEENFYTI